MLKRLPLGVMVTCLFTNCEGVVSEPTADAINAGGEAITTGRALPTVSVSSVADVDLIEKSLMILDPSVVDSSEAASQLDSSSATGLGAWSFGHLVAEIAGSQDPADFAERFMNQLAKRQVVNGFVSEPTLNVVQGTNDAQQALDRWCRRPDGKLDFGRAPFRLLAIVNRPDLRQGANELGELRFIFSLLQTDEQCVSNPAALPQVQGGTGIAIIFEFAHPTASCKAQQLRAQAWAQLAQSPFGDGYNSALRSLTEFVVKARDLTRPNGSQLNQVRVNTGASPSQWTFRELHLGGRTPNLATSLNPLLLVSPAAVPDFSTFNNSPELAQYVSEHQTDIAAGTLMLQPVPDVFLGKNFGAATSDILAQWRVGDVAQGAFSFMTCGGCHAHQAFGPHVGLVPPPPALVGRALGEPARVSGFLRDFSGAPSGDLFLRAGVLQALSSSNVCATIDAFGVVSSTSRQIVNPGDTIRVNSIADASAASRKSAVLGLYRTTDSDRTPPVASVTFRNSSSLVLSTITAPATPGDYDVRRLVGFERFAVSRPVQVALNGYTVTPNTVASAGGVLEVSWQAPADHAATDLIGVFRPGDADTAPLASIQTGAGVNGSFDGLSVFGTVSLTLPTTPGAYELRMLRGGSGIQVANFAGLLVQ